MTTTATLSSPPGQLRRISLRRDLSQVADLVELSFANTLDADGKRFIRQMRNSARTPQMIGIGGYIPSNVSGYVWESGGVIVGNLNTIPITVEGERSYLIANVAVHPDFRKRSIARALTEAALADLRRRRASSVWLQVRDDNPAAYNLYHTQGFEEIARRTTWHSKPFTDLNSNSTHAQIVQRRREDWPQQRLWLRNAYPTTLTWQLPLNLSALRPGLGGAFTRMITERNFAQWSYVLNSELAGTLVWQSSYTQADWLWLGADPAHEIQALEALLPYATRNAPRRRTMALNYPAGSAVDTISALGFHAHLTLVWMKTALS